MKLISNLSPNYQKKARKKNDKIFIIFHYTGMQSEIESINRLKNKKSKVSCHYLINRKGEVIQMVKDLNVAWHAGKSRWDKYVNLNENSIGIELVNKGHKYGYQNFTKKQIDSLIRLCKNLKKKYLIKQEHFLGHSDIAPLRKSDPGEKFPWGKLSINNLGKWYIKRPYNIEVNFKKMRSLFFKNLKQMGYRYFRVNRKSSNDKKIVKSFQQHYSQNNVTGKLDKKTYKISYFLTH